MLNRKRLSRLVAALLIGFMIAFYASTILYQTNLERIYYEEEQEELDLFEDQVVNSYNLAFQIVLEREINQPEVLALFSEARNADPEQQTDIRAALLDLLTPTYDELQQIGIQQFHLHLPDNTSFLRLHAPDQFGDDLSTIDRKSVV
jgi:hypothetical protein